MKLIFLMPATTGGGIEVSVPIIASNIENSLYGSVHVIGINSCSAEESTMIENGVQIRGLGRESGGVLSTIRAFNKFRSLFKDLNEDATVVANGEVAEVFVLFTKRKFKRIVVVEHTSAPWPRLRWFGRLVRRSLVRASAEWITVISDAKEIWPGITHFRWIPNPLSAPRVRKYPSTAEVGLIYIGRLIESKNPRLVCKVAKNLGVRLDIYGTGPLQESLRTEFSNFRNIVFHGHVKNVWDEVEASSILVVASQYEGDGRVVAEAVVRAQPILLFDTADHRRFPFPETNFFNGEEELEMKIKQTLGTGAGDLVPSRAFREALMAARSIEVVARDWNQLLRY